MPALGEGTGIVPITPAAPADAGDATASLTAFAVTETDADKSTGVIAGTITFTGDLDMVVKLLSGTTQVAEVKLAKGGDGSFVFTGLAAGSYTINAYYWGKGSEAPAITKACTVAVKGAEDDKPVAIEANVEVGKDYVLVTVTKATAGETMYIFFADQEEKVIKLNEAMRFDGLKPGDYDIEIDYENPTGLAPYCKTVTIADPATLKAIQIQSVVPGENKLTVVGSAEPETNVTLTTEPASTTTIIKTDAAGLFTVALTCEPKTYTKVTAQYGGDTASAVSFAGEFVVTAPAAKPTLTVDEVTADSTTVTAKTTPGTLVEIRTDDYSQRVTADSDGLLRFSLPHTYPKDTTLTFTVYYGKDNKESFTQSATVAAAHGYKLLKKGDKGDAVKRLTTRLKELGYPVSVKSTYDDSVVTAVYLFEKANGLPADGAAGSLMQSTLFSVAAIPYTNTTRYPTFVRGDRDHPLIYALQQRLKDLGYYTIRVDGIFGSGTQRAVRDFQRVNGLTVTGRADNATQTLLYSSAAKPASGSSSGEYKTLVRSGYYQAEVVPMQRRLKQLGYYSGSVDGYFGSNTYRAVRNFQSRNGLDVTGKADPTTQRVLYSSNAKPASGSSGSGSSTGYRLLYWGCTGSAVTRLQNALISAGYKSIVRTADGIYGRWTYDAVRAYQRDHGLAVDGIAGKKTQNSLYGTSY